MLHTHSYNMGLIAGIAWKNAGKDHFYLSAVESEQEAFMLEVFRRTEVDGGGIDFLPSSFLEGFYNAFYTEQKIIANP